MPSKLPVDAVVFDVHHTLIKPSPSYPDRAALWADLYPDLIFSDLQQALSTDTHNGRMHVFSHLRTHEAYLEFSSQIRRDAIRAKLATLPPFAGANPSDATAREQLDSATSEVLQRYHEYLFGQGLKLNGVQVFPQAELAGWAYTHEPYEDALALLHALRDKGVPAGAGTNWDWDAEGTLRAAKFGPDLVPGQHILCSAQVGIRKPNPYFFLRAQQMMGARSLLWVGDSWESDVVGAKRAQARFGIDIQVAYINRSGEVRDHIPKHVMVVDDLRELLGAVEPAKKAAAVRMHDFGLVAGHDRRPPDFGRDRRPALRPKPPQVQSPPRARSSL